MNIQTVVISLVLSLVSAQDRKIIPTLNPGCGNSCNFSNVSLVYINSVGAVDSLHQLWDFTRGVPTVIFAITEPNTTLQINWDGIKPSSFNFSQKVKYSFALAIDQLIQYNDVDDIGYINNNSKREVLQLDNMKWIRKNNSILTDKEAMVELMSWLPHKRGYISIKLDLLPFKDYAVELPHLVHTANSTLIDISLVNATTRREYNASRFAWHTTIVSTDVATEEMYFQMRKSLDDEHTPGVFEIIAIKTPKSYYGDDGGFVQFRPVSYTSAERNVASSTIVHVSSFENVRIPARSTLARFYREFDSLYLLERGVATSFGEAGDGYYRRYNYTSWTFTIGYGAPPSEGFSLFVVMVISIGLGVPVLLALSGVAYVLARRLRQRRHRPTRFTNDD